MVLQAFWEIHPMRFSQMGHRPLNIGDILTWCEFHAITTVDFRMWLWWFIQRLDRLWLELAEQDAERRRRHEEWERNLDA